MENVLLRVSVLMLWMFIVGFLLNLLEIRFGLVLLFVSTVMFWVLGVAALVHLAKEVFRHFD